MVDSGSRDRWLAHAQNVGTGSECHNYAENSNNDHVSVLGSWTLLANTTARMEDAFYCGGQANTTIAPIYGNNLTVLTRLLPWKNGKEAHRWGVAE